MPELAGEINATLSGPTEVLSPGDQLTLRFVQFPDWNHETTIRADGRASFLSIDDVQVAGLTLEQLDARLTDAYAEILTQPELTILVIETAERNYFIMGEVGEPGSYPITSGRTTLIEALAQAQGPIRGTANLDHTLLVRWLPTENRTVAWKIDARTKHWGSPISILLQPHDVVFVPAEPVVHVNDWIERYIRLMIPLPLINLGTGI